VNKTVIYAIAKLESETTGLQSVSLLTVSCTHPIVNAIAIPLYVQGALMSYQRLGLSGIASAL
jgi:hypothetical protein